MAWSVQKLIYAGVHKRMGKMESEIKGTFGTQIGNNRLTSWKGWSKNLYAAVQKYWDEKKRESETKKEKYNFWI